MCSEMQNINSISDISPEFLTTALRWTSKDKKYQVEGFVDKGIENKGIPKGYNGGLIFRYNR